MSSPIYLHYSLSDEAFFDPQNNALRGAFALIRNDVSLFRVQCVLNRGATVSLSTYQASNRTLDLSTYTGTPAFGLKTETLYAADGDYAQAWSGYATDATWHSLANGRFSLNTAPTITPAGYVCEFQLMTVGSAAWTIHGAGVAEGKTRCLILRDVIIGSETSAPAGTVTTSGTATIVAGNTSVVVTLTGMTATGNVIPSLLGVSELTTISATPGTGQFTINIGGTYASNVTVGYFVTALS